MSEFKTRAEMGTALEFIQYLEQVKSGSLTANEGINRALERLAENDNALLNLAMTAQMQHFTYTGTVSYTDSTKTLDFSTGATLTLFFSSPADVARTNVISTPVSVVLPNAFSVVYAILDRSSDGATVAFATATNTLAYQNLLEAAADRADYFLFAVGDGVGGLILFNGKHLRDGESLTNNGATDSQYGQQTELTLVRNNQKDNLKFLLTRGGDISWDAGTGTITFGDDLYIEYPAAAGSNRVLAASFVVGAGSALYVTLSRSPVGAVTLAPAVASLAGGVPNTDDTFVLGAHKAADSRFYLWDGTALSDGETVKLGGVRIGVQFYYREPGLGVNTQKYDLTSLVSGSAEYRVGTGELMVYRNGRKATPSKAYWEGVYGVGGSLNVSAGGLSSLDDYIEEDADGVGGALTGNRIIWLREDPTPSGGALTADEIATSLYFAAGTYTDGHVQTFPQADDIVEIFIGNQGAAPTITIPNGIYGFETVWTQSPSTLRTKGGTVVVQGTQYRSTGATNLEVVLDGTTTPAAVFTAETLSAASWAYIYLGPGVSVGGDPDIRISTSPPDDSAGEAGFHPSDSRYKFLTSVYVRTLSAFREFTKSGSWVHLGQNSDVDISGAFAAAVSGTFENVDISGFLPATFSGAVKVQLEATTTGTPSAGDSVVMSMKQTGFGWVGSPLTAIKPGNTADAQFTFEVMTDDGTFDVRFSAVDFSAVASGIVLGYAEGRFTSGDTLGV